MSHRTRFAGLAAPDVGETTQVLNGDFIYQNPDLTDQFLRIGALTHRHDAHLALPNPVEPFTLVPAASGGALSGSADFYATWTMVDQYGGETLAAPTAHFTTSNGVPEPSASLLATVDTSTGIMLAGGYAYAETYTDGAGGETTLGPVTWVYIDAGFAQAQISITFEPRPVGAVTRRLWRSYEGEDWHLVVETTANSFTDAGFDPPDNPARPPDTNTTGETGSVSVFWPADIAAQPGLASATRLRAYFSDDPDLASPSLVADWPINLVPLPGFTITAFSASAGEPPAVSTSIPGAAKINPDTDIVDWHWKRPAANIASLPATGNASADARVVMNPLSIFVWTDPGHWQPVAAASGIGGGGGGLAGIVLTDGLTGASALVNTRLFTEAIGAGITQKVTDLGLGQGFVTTYLTPWVASAGSAGGGASAKIGNGGLGDGQNDLWGDWQGEIAFVGSGAATTSIKIVGGTPVLDPDGITRTLGGSAVVTITVPPGGGAPGATGATGAQGPAGPPGNSLGVGGAGATPLVTPTSYIEFTASGGTGVAVTNLGGGSARVLISGGAGGGGGGGGSTVNPARAHLNAAQSITSNTWTQVKLDTVDFDPDSAWHGSPLWHYTVASAGKYLVTGEVAIQAPAGATQLEVAINVNGSDVSYGSREDVSTSGKYRVVVSDVLDLAANDTVQLNVRSTAQNATLDAGFSQQNYLSIAPVAAAGADGATGATGPQGPAGPTSFEASAGTASATVGPFLGFVGSGAASVQLSTNTGSAIVTITVPQPLKGDTGATGATGPTGPTGPPGTGGGGAASIGVDGSAGVSLVTPISDIRFIGSGAASASIANLGGGSAQVTITAVPGSTGAAGAAGPTGATGASGATTPATQPTFVGMASNGGSGNTVIVPSNVQVGDLIVVAFTTWTGGDTPNAPTISGGGGSFIQLAANTVSGNLGVFYKVAAASDAGATITVSTTPAHTAATVVRCYRYATITGNSGASLTASSVNQAPPSLTANDKNQLAVAFCGSFFSLSTYSPNAPINGQTVSGTGANACNVSSQDIRTTASGATATSPLFVLSSSQQAYVATILLAGSTPGPIVAASGGASAINPDYYTEYAGSGGVAVAVQDMGGGSARVLIGTGDGGTATLTAGTVTVTDPSVSATSRILLTAQDNNTTGALRVSARSPGVSFTITSSNAGDTGLVAYQFFGK